jgi:hypothetical protein
VAPVGPILNRFESRPESHPRATPALGVAQHRQEIDHLLEVVFGPNGASLVPGWQATPM